MSIVTAALLIVELVAQMAIIAQRTGALIKTARAEGRDITDAELETLRAESKSVFDRLMATK